MCIFVCLRKAHFMASRDVHLPSSTIPANPDPLLCLTLLVVMLSHTMSFPSCDALTHSLVAQQGQ